MFTTAGTDEKVGYLKKLTGGKVHAFNYKTTDFEQEVKKVDEAGVDLIVDFIGPDYWNQVGPTRFVRCKHPVADQLSSSGAIEHLVVATGRSHDLARRHVRS